METWAEMIERHRLERLAMTRLDKTTQEQEMADIVEKLTSGTGISLDDILGSSRLASIARVRQAAYWYSREGGISFNTIGRFFNRDHTTIIHGCRKHERRAGL